MATGIIKTVKNWWDSHPQLAAWLFALPTGMLVLLGTYFTTDTGDEVYAKNYSLQQVATMLSVIFFLFLSSRPNVSRKGALISMVIMYVGIQIIYTKFHFKQS